MVAFGQLGSCPKAICEAMPLLKGNAEHVRTYLPVTTRHYAFMTDPAYADTFDHTCGFMMPSTREGLQEPSGLPPIRTICTAELTAGSSTTEAMCLLSALPPWMSTATSVCP